MSARARSVGQNHATCERWHKMLCPATSVTPHVVPRYGRSAILTHAPRRFRQIARHPWVLDLPSHGRYRTTSDYFAGMRKAISVIKNRFNSGGRQQPAEDLPPCRGADSRRHRIRSHYLKGTRGQQVVDAIGIYCREPGTGNATIPNANRSARARIAARSRK